MRKTLLVRGDLEDLQRSIDSLSERCRVVKIVEGEASDIEHPTPPTITAYLIVYEVEI
jgi:hypothetical protein